jgi:hypothetical protein
MAITSARWSDESPGWSDAARKASRPRHGPSATSRPSRPKPTAVVENGEIVEYSVDLKIGFEYEG